MMGLGWPELVIILFIVVIIFGAGKLPEIGGAVGRGIKEFRTATTDEMNQNDNNDVTTSGEARKDVS
jgi:sec-independent protein translocase protein TatA